MSKMAAPMKMWRTVLSAKKCAFHMSKQLPVCCAPVRWLHLHEYQSKKLMLDAEVEVQHFEVVESSEQAREAAHRLKFPEYVIKAQIMAGGRGRGTFSNGFKGGVHLTKDADKVADLVKNMVGYRLTTKQTLPEGVEVRKVMVAEALDIAREAYFAIVLDRHYAGPVIIGSKHGGMDIEELAHTDPDSIFKEPIDIMAGITEEQATRIAEQLGFEGNKTQVAATQVKNLYNMFVKVDATQIEINPFGETPDGRVVCFDAKIQFDDNSEYRQRDIFDMDDISEMDPREAEAARLHLNYIGLEGNIGCLVNGAGLAMATMDIIKLHGGEPANFLDVGGAVTEEQVFNAFNLLTHDTHVKVILINVFGGIVNCATVANGIIRAYKKANVTLPMVVRLEGTNATAAKKILADSGLKIMAADDFEDVAIKAVGALPRPEDVAVEAVQAVPKSS